MNELSNCNKAGSRQHILSFGNQLGKWTTEIALPCHYILMEGQVLMWLLTAQSNFYPKQI